MPLQTLREALSPNRSPVAEANSSVFFLLLVYYSLDAGQLREIQTSARLATSPFRTCGRFSLLSTVLLLYHWITQSARGC
jgi:hypothetical protein